MLIYRVENKRKEGIYSASNRDNFDNVRWDGFENGVRHPCPREDRLIRNPWYEMSSGQRKRFRFGFSSRKQLKTWFFTKKVRKAIHDDGFHISVYEIETKNVIKGESQAIFRKCKAKLVGRISMVQLDIMNLV
jgi:hypothetical protein